MMVQRKDRYWVVWIFIVVLLVASYAYGHLVIGG